MEGRVRRSLTLHVSSLVIIRGELFVAKETPYGSQVDTAILNAWPSRQVLRTVASFSWPRGEALRPRLKPRHSRITSK